MTRSRKSSDVQTNSDLADGTLSLKLVDQCPGPVVSWAPEEEEKYSHLAVEVELAEVNSYRLSDDGNQLVLILRDGTNINPLIFLDEGPEDFIDKLDDFVCVKRSHSDGKLFLLRDHVEAELDESLLHLNLFDNGFGSGGGVGGGPPGAASLWKFVSDVQRDPYSTAMSTFSKVAERLIHAGEDSRPEDEVAELLHRSLASPGPSDLLDTTTATTEDGDEYEVITERPRVLEAPLPEVSRSSSPLTRTEWETFFDAEGRLIDERVMRDRVFRGGGVADPSVRGELWKFLLGYFDGALTFDERTELRGRRVDDYYRMKLQWETITEAQERLLLLPALITRPPQFQLEKLLLAA